MTCNCDEIGKEVIHIINSESGKTVTVDTKIHDVLNTYQIEYRLPGAFTILAKECKKNASVSKGECEALKTVKDAIDLVCGKIA